MYEDVRTAPHHIFRIQGWKRQDFTRPFGLILNEKRYRHRAKKFRDHRFFLTNHSFKKIKEVQISSYQLPPKIGAIYFMNEIQKYEEK